MEKIDKAKRGSLFKFKAWVSLVLLVVTLWDIRNSTDDYLSGAEGTLLDPIKFFMLFMVMIAFLIFLTKGKGKNENNLFLWFAVFYAFYGMFSVLTCGLYSVRQMPFASISLSYWVWVLIISYYSVLQLNTLKFHVFIVGLFLPVLFYFFITARNAYQGHHFGDTMLLNPAFYIYYWLPTILLIRKKTLKISGVMVVFAAVLLSYKRSAFLGFVTAVPVYLYARNAISTSAKLKKLMLVTFGGAFLILLLAFMFNYVVDAVGLDWTGRLVGLSEDKGSGRLDRYIAYMDLIGSQPFFSWIFGNGYRSTMYTKLSWPHNDIIEVLYSFGLIGLMFYLLFLGQLTKLFFEMKKYKYRHFDAFAVSLVLFFWGAMFSIFIMYPDWFLGLAFFWGWVIADFHNAKKFGDRAGP